MANHLTRTQRKALRKRNQAAQEAAQGKKRWANLGFKAILYLISFLGGGFFVSVFHAQPRVQLQHLDSKDPYLFPFRIVNDETFLTFYQVQVIADTATSDYSQLVTLSNEPGNMLREGSGMHFRIGAEDRNDPLDIPAGHGHSFDFLGHLGPEGGKEVPDDFALTLKLAYQIRLLPFVHTSFLSLHRNATFSYHALKDSSGTPYWVQD